VDESTVHGKDEWKRIVGLRACSQRSQTDKKEKGAAREYSKRNLIGTTKRCLRIGQERQKLVKSPNRDVDRFSGHKTTKHHNKGREGKVRRGTSARWATANQCGQGGRGKLGVEPLSVCNRARFPQICVRFYQREHVELSHQFQTDYMRCSKVSRFRD
jgi:hypothetical protein